MAGTYLVPGSSASADQAAVKGDIGALSNDSGVSAGQTAIQGATNDAASIAGSQGQFNDLGTATANQSLSDLANQYQQTLSADYGGKSAGGILQDQLISGGGNRSALAQAIQAQAQATGQSQGAAAQGKLSANAQQIMNQLHANLLQAQANHTQQAAQFDAQNSGDQLANQTQANQIALKGAASSGQNGLNGINLQNNNAQWQQGLQIAGAGMSALSTGLSAGLGMSGGQSGVSPQSSGAMSLSPGNLQGPDLSLQTNPDMNQSFQLQQPTSLGDSGAGQSYGGFQIQPLQLTSY